MLKPIRGDRMQIEYRSWIGAEFNVYIFVKKVDARSFISRDGYSLPDRSDLTLYVRSADNHDSKEILVGPPAAVPSRFLEADTVSLKPSQVSGKIMSIPDLSGATVVVEPVAFESSFEYSSLLSLDIMTQRGQRLSIDHFVPITVRGLLKRQRAFWVTIPLN